MENLRGELYFVKWKSLFWTTAGGMVSLATTVFMENRLLKVSLTILGAMLGWVFYRWVFGKVNTYFKKISGQDLLIKGLGLLFGVLLTALFTVTMRSILEFVFPKNWMGIQLTLLIVISGLSVLAASEKSNELYKIIFNSVGQANSKPVTVGNQFKILDTSAIIDGRISDLCKTGFVEGVLVVPSFVLGELQKIADSADSLRRNRGRRGLDLLNKMQKENQIAIKIFDCDYDEITEVDTKLLRLAREMEAKVVTNDFNLNKVAEIYGVEVLNINELSNAIKPVLLPGEEMIVHVLRDGKEYGQGIGYLEDGTMIVVEGGKSFIGIDLEILVTSVLQTSAGRMIFAKPKDILLSKITS